MNWKKILTVLVAVFCFLIVGVIVKAYLDGEFESVETLQIYIKSFGLFAPLILIVIQALQVIIPILPGFLGCAVGAVLFGSAGGFWCNYILLPAVFPAGAHRPALAYARIDHCVFAGKKIRSKAGGTFISQRAV